MYSRYVPNKLLIVHKSRLLQIRLCGVAHCRVVSEVYGLFRRVSFSEEMTDWFWLVGLKILIVVLNRQIVLSNSGLPAPIKTPEWF